MKNLLILLCLILPFTLFAQEKTADDIDYKYHLQGSHSFHIGVGFPNKINSGFTIANQLGVDLDGGASPVYTIKYEYGLTPEIGAGLHLGYFTAKTPRIADFEETVTTFVDQLGGIVDELGCLLFECDTMTTTESREGGYDKYTVLTPGIRLAYHQRVLENLDTYGSVVLGYNVIRKKRNGGSNLDLTQYTNKIPTFAYFTSAGLRYYFSPQWAAYGELGYGTMTVVNVGLTYRL